MYGIPDHTGVESGVNYSIEHKIHIPSSGEMWMCKWFVQCLVVPVFPLPAHRTSIQVEEWDEIYSGDLNSHVQVLGKMKASHK